MPRQKMLKTNGSSISSFTVEITQVRRRLSNKMIDVINLNISTTDGDYSYRINSDTREPDLDIVRQHIHESLNRSKNDYLNVKISEKERNYFFLRFKMLGKNNTLGGDYE